MLLLACQLSRGVIGYEVSKRDWFLFDPVFCQNYNDCFFVGRIVGCIFSSHSIVVSFCVKLNLITPLVQNEKSVL